MGVPRLSVLRPYLLAVGVISVGIAAKIAFAGLGTGLFNISTLAVVCLAVVGAVLIALGWQRRSAPKPDSEEGLTEETAIDDNP